MESINMDTEKELQLQEEYKKHLENIRNLEPEELTERLAKSLEATEVILEGYNLVTNINEGHGIAVAGIIKLRETISDTLEWLNYQILEVDEDDEEESDEL
jgi:hypothetical protein